MAQRTTACRFPRAERLACSLTIEPTIEPTTEPTTDADDTTTPIITVKDFEAMLISRKDELTFSDTGRGWALLSSVKLMPIAEVMTILRGA